MRPDAVFIDANKQEGDNPVARTLSMHDVADKYLEVDTNSGEKSHCRNQMDGTYFATRSIGCSINHPEGHPREKTPRYNWTIATDDPGVRLGYLKEQPPVANPTPAPSPSEPGRVDVVVAPGALIGDANLVDPTA